MMYKYIYQIIFLIFLLGCSPGPENKSDEELSGSDVRLTVVQAKKILHDHLMHYQEMSFVDLESQFGGSYSDLVLENYRNPKYHYRIYTTVDWENEEARAIRVYASFSEIIDGDIDNTIAQDSVVLNR